MTTLRNSNKPPAPHCTSGPSPRSATHQPCKSVVEIVVSDLPLRHDVALAARFDERSGQHNPPFLCGITEFTRLIEFGHRGCSVPTIVHAWRLNSHGRSLGLYLSAHPLAPSSAGL